MKYSSYTKAQLLKHIEEIEAINRELLKEKEHEKNLEYGWKGNLGHWYWNIKTNSVMFNSLKVTNLGYLEYEIPEHVTYQFFTDKLHPGDYDRVMAAMYDHMVGKVPAYEVEYRIQAKDGSYRWYYDRGKITEYDEEGKPLLVAGIVFDISSDKQLEEEFRRLSHTDPLTKVYNRRYFITRLEELMEQIKKNKNGDSFCVAMVDVDDFKQINDRFDHQFGDCVLQKISKKLTSAIREEDCLARWGGDEFILFLPNLNKEQALDMLQIASRKIHKLKFSNEATTSISVGVTEYIKGDSVDSIIRRADQMMYKSKKAGKNCVR